MSALIVHTVSALTVHPLRANTVYIDYYTIKAPVSALRVYTINEPSWLPIVYTAFAGALIVCTIISLACALTELTLVMRVDVLYVSIPLFFNSLPPENVGVLRYCAG